MDKIRPKKILKGFAEAAKTFITGDEKGFTIARKKYCFAPCEHNNNGKCKLCGCVLLAKTEVEDTYCPDNRWEDVKMLDNGIAVKIFNLEKVKLTKIDDSSLEVKFLHPLKTKADGTFEIGFINDRANFGLTPDNLTAVSLHSSCGCTVVTKLPQTFPDGTMVKTEVRYNPEGRTKGPFAKTLKLLSNQLTITIRLKGENYG